MTPRSIAAEQAAPAIVCHCGQLLAHRYGSVIVAQGVMVKKGNNGMIRLVCPKCGARIPVSESKEAA